MKTRHRNKKVKGGMNASAKLPENEPVLLPTRKHSLKR
jgi:hypothetical protein